MTLHDTLRQLLDAAQQFETKTPQYKRIESERQALREAMTHAQLRLSVPESPKESDKATKKGLRSLTGGRSGKRSK